MVEAAVVYTECMAYLVSKKLLVITCIDKNVLSFKEWFFSLAIIAMLLPVSHNWVSWLFSCCKHQFSELSKDTWTVKKKERHKKKRAGGVWGVVGQKDHVRSHPQTVFVFKAQSSSVLGRVIQGLKGSMCIQCVLEWDLQWLKNLVAFGIIITDMFLLGDYNHWSQIHQYSIEFSHQ